MDPSASVDELKARLSQDTGIPLGGQRLVFKGQELVAGTVAGNGINEEDFIVVVVIQQSGVKPDIKSTNAKANSPLHRREETTNFQDQSSNPTHQFHENRQVSRNSDVDADEDVVENNDDVEEGIDEVDPDSLQQLMDMGFPANRANKALIITRGNTQLAMDWLLEHERDPDIDEPLTIEQIDRIHAGEDDDEYGDGEGEDGIMMIDPQEAAQRLMELGFTEEDIAYALEATGHDFEAAAAWLLGDYFPPPPPPPPGHASQEPPYHGEDPDDDGDDDDREPRMAGRHEAGVGHR